MWCISPEDGLWELAVCGVIVGPGVECRTVWCRKDTPDDDDGRPSAWLAVTGHLQVFAGGGATVTAP